MTKQQLINAKGGFEPGLIEHPVDVINYQDYDLRTVMDKPRSWLAKRWRFNQFQFVSAMAPGWIFGLAIIDLKFLGSGFFYLYDFSSGQMLEQSFRQPFARHTLIEPFPERGLARFATHGVKLSIEPSMGGRSVRVEAPGNIRADLNITDTGEPLRLVCPAGYNGWVFTRKSAGLAVEGEVRWGQQVWRCDEQARASIDWSCGFMRRETAWNWACLAGVTAGGTTVGLNLAAGVNETGMTENALWLDGRCIRLGAARFVFDRYHAGSGWRVTTDDGRVELAFEPAGQRKERLNAWLLASNFRQFAGTFQGWVLDDAGQKVPVDGLRGLVEDHFARW
ncbi:MAG TPA: DUF2804 domain-containing protein [Marinobacter sp.]|nr:DUF2804 domain-containing protein [Marinobacter sp.]